MLDRRLRPPARWPGRGTRPAGPRPRFRYGLTTVRRIAWRTYSVSSTGLRVDARRLAQASRIDTASRMETRSRNRFCSTRCTAARGSSLGTRSSTTLGFSSATRSSSFLASCRENSSWACRRISLGQVRADHADRVDHRVSRRRAPARPGRLGIQRPACPKAGSRVGLPSTAGFALARRDGQFAALRQLEAGDLRAFERDHVFAAAQREVVGHPHGRQQVAELRGELPADSGDAAQQRRVLRALHQLTRPRPTSTASGSTFSSASRFSLRRRRLARAPARPICRASLLPHAASRRTRPAAQQQERKLGQARQGRQRDQDPARQQQRLRHCRRSAAGTPTRAAHPNWRG